MKRVFSNNNKIIIKNVYNIRRNYLLIVHEYCVKWWFPVTIISALVTTVLYNKISAE